MNWIPEVVDLLNDLHIEYTLWDDSIVMPETSRSTVYKHIDNEIERVKVLDYSQYGEDQRQSDLEWLHNVRNVL